MLARTLRRTPSPSSSSRPKPPGSRRVRWPRLTLEALEDRVVPAYVDLGTAPHELRFVADSFTVTNNTYTANGQIKLGFTPTGTEAFTPLVNISTPNQGVGLSLTVGTPDPKFMLTRATISSVVQGAPDPDIWSTSGSFTFDATALATTGVPLASGGLPFATSEGQFKLDNIRFADPTGGDTSDAQVKLQGTLGSVPTLVGLSMSVGDSNFLILDGTGYTLTGVEQALSGGLSVGVINRFGNLGVLRNDGIPQGRTQPQFTLVDDWFDLGFPFNPLQMTINGYWVGKFVPGNSQPQVAVLAQGILDHEQTAVVNVGYYDVNGNSTNGELYLNFSGTPSGMVGGDINGDGWTDLFLGFQNQPPVLLYGGPNGVGQQVQPVNGLPGGGPVIVGDINGDGLMDLGIFDSNTAFHYAIQDQAGNFNVYSTNIGPYFNVLNAALLQDVNGDLKPDLVFLSNANGPQQALYVSINTGNEEALFTRQTTWSLAPGAQGGLGLAAADLDRDGLSDLIVLDRQAGNTESVRNRSVINTPALVAVVDGGRSTGNDFLDAQSGQINGRVFDDVTRDGNSLLGKPGRQGVTVYVDLNRNGRLDAREPRSVTGPDGYYAFSGLPAGTYQVRWIDGPNRRPTTPERGVHQVRLLRRGQALNGLDFGNAVSIDRRLAIPPDGSRDWTVRANGGRLEVLDRVKGVVDSLPLEELNSLTILGTNGRSDRLTVDTRGGFFVLRGGILFDGGAGPGDSLQVVLGPGNDVATFTNPRLVIDAGLVVRATQIEGLSIDAGAGDDRITLAGAPLRGVVQVDGGAGDDVLTGGAGNDILLGGAGDDVLFGQGGRDLLIGGLGRDLLLGGPGDDLLVAGATAFDRDAQALQAILAEWASGRDYATRVRNLTGTGNGNRANGDNFLEAATVPDDHVLDVLFGGADRNWFLSFPSDLLPDRRRDERIGW